MTTMLERTSSSLLDQIKVELTPEQELALIKIDTYPFDKVVERILKDGSIPEDQVDEAVAEFRKYLTFVALGWDRVGMTSPIIDEVWHAFILHTRDYATFCEEVFGFFVHHNPDSSIEPIDPDSGPRLFDAYEAVFGPVPAIWGTRERASSECSGTTNCQDSPGGCDSGNCNWWGGAEGDDG